MFCVTSEVQLFFFFFFGHFHIFMSMSKNYVYYITTFISKFLKLGKLF